MALRGGIAPETPGLETSEREAVISSSSDRHRLVISSPEWNPWDESAPLNIYPLLSSPLPTNFPSISPISPLSQLAGDSPSDHSDSDHSVLSHGFRGFPVPPELIPIPESPVNSPTMSTRRYVIQPEKPEKFGGEEGEDVDEFLVTMDMYLRSIHIPEGTMAEVERYKLVLLHKHLTGRANIFWYELTPEKRATYALAAAELGRRFPAPNHDMTRLDMRNQAIAEMNSLTQGTRTSKAYAEYAQDLYTKLGDEYAVALATRFIDGINNQVIQIQLDGHLNGVYTPFSQVIRVYLACTTTVRRKEAVAAKEAAGVKKGQETETHTGYEQMMQQMGDMFKNFSIGAQGTNQNQNPGTYQPIVGSVGLPTPQSPRSTPYQAQREYRPRVEVTCFRCGMKGHRSYECSNNSLPREEQERLRNEFVRTNMGPRNAGSYNPQVVAHVSMSQEEEGTDPVGTMMMSANLVEAFGGGETEEVRRLRERVACLEAAMAEKRGRTRTGDTTLSDEPHRRRPRRGDRSESPTGSRQMYAARIRSPLINTQPGTTARTPPMVVMDRQSDVLMPDVILPDPETAQPHEGQPFIPDPYFQDPAVYSRFIPSASVPKIKRSRPKGPKPPKRHIKMLQGMTVWDPVDELRKLPVTGLDYGNLFDIAPTIRVAISKSLQLEQGLFKPKTKPKNKAPQSGTGPIPEAAVNAVTGLRKRIMDVTGGVLSEPNNRFFNFYTNGEVLVYDNHGKRKGHGIEMVLIDGGAVVNLMPEGVARKLNLELVKNTDIVIRTATSEVRPVRYCVRVDVNIAGVIARITAYVLDIPQSYSLLLGRRWLYQVRAVGDYAKQAYVIYDAEGKPHEVAPTGEGARGMTGTAPEVLVNPDVVEPLDLTEQEREEIVVGQVKMQEIIARVITDAKSQVVEQLSDSETDEERETDDSGDDFYDYPGSEDGHQSPKGRQQ